jgi:4-hydroxybenzoate polyprenyltransferase
MTSFKSSLPYLILKSARPRQWVKNFSLYATLVFSGFFFAVQEGGTPYLVTVSYAFLIFCLLTSSVYIINDIIDYQADRQHPFKKKRPIASGKLPIPVALFTAIVLLALVFFFSLWLGWFFRILTFGYLILQYLYATKIKHIAILDVISIATGFLIRVYAGAVVVNLHMSVWFLLTVISASLFLAVGKRQSERTLLSGIASSEIGDTRKALKRYSQRLLDQYTGMFATATWLTYALFTFQTGSIKPEQNALIELYTILPRTLRSEKLLMLSLPLVIFGIMRYLQLVYEDNQGESPDKVLFRDKPLLATFFLFGLVVMTVIYVL